MLTLKERQTGLAIMCHERKLIDRDVLDFVKTIKPSHDVVDILLMIVEQEYKDLKVAISILVRMAQNSK